MRQRHIYVICRLGMTTASGSLLISRPRSQFFTIRTDPKPVNNLFIFFQVLKRKKLTEKNSRKRYCDRCQRQENLKKTQTLIFQKQHRKSTRDKFSFFLNGTPIAKASQYTYLGVTFNTNGSFSKNGKKTLHTQFYKYYLGLNRRAPNIAARNETGRLSLKFQELLNFCYILSLSQKIALPNNASIFPINWQMKQSPLSC